ncbi:MAG: phosphatase PAP2 family protein [Candidatus Limnocylindrales bacterium]
MTDLDLARSGELRLRNERLLLLGLACYTLLIGALIFQNSAAITPDVIVVAIALGGVLMLRGRTWLSDWTPIVALLLAYELMRGLADDAGFPLQMASLIEAERMLALGTLPTQVLQDAMRPVAGVDWIALLSTGVYMFHFLIPIITGVLLWAWRRNQFHDFMAALIVLSMAAFTTYLLMPAAPPWYAAGKGLLDGPDGLPLIAYLKPETFADVGAWLGLDGNRVYDNIFYAAGPNDVAAWPSLHVAYPFLAFLVLRRAFGRIAWIVAGYAAVVAFSVVYTGDHWVHDGIAGAAYAYVAYYIVVHTPPSVRERFDRVFLPDDRDDPLPARTPLGEVD